MNWGYKISIVIIAFILIMLSMVFVAMRQTNEMEDTNYYERELVYQDKIDAAKNLNEAGNEGLLTQTPLGILIHIPQQLVEGFEKGQLEFLRTDNKKKDLNLKFKPDSSGLFLVERSKFSLGFYKVRIAWDSKQKHYYREQTISIQ